MNEKLKGWNWVKISEVAKNSNKVFIGKEFPPVLSVTKHKGFMLSSEYFDRQVFSKNLEKYKLVLKGEFAYATIHLDEGSIDVLRKFDEGLISPMYTVFKVNDIDSEFLIRVLKSDLFINKYSTLGQGSIDRRMSIPFNVLKELEIPYPPINEQKKIAKILTLIERVIDLTSLEVDKLKDLKRGMMQELLTKGVAHTKFKESSCGKIPDGWDVIALKDTARIARGSSPRPAGDPRYFNGNYINWVTVGEVTKDDNIFLNTTKTFLTELGKSESTFIKKGTVVLTNSGATLGYAKILNIDCCANDGIAIFFDVKQNIDSVFLYLFLDTIGERFRNSIARGVGQPNLNTELIGDVIMPLPPLQEQKKISDILMKVTERVRTLEKKNVKLNVLKKGLISDLLTGKVRVKT